MIRKRRGRKGRTRRFLNHIDNGENIRLSTKVLLDSFLELRRKLNGKCGGSCPSLVTIPNSLSLSLEFRTTYFARPKQICSTCVKEFGWLPKLKYTCICPCNRVKNKEEIMVRLDEFIEELHDRLKKEYSN